MLKFSNSVFSTTGWRILFIGATLVLAGCKAEDVALSDFNPKDSVDERYPIKVTEAPVKMGLANHGSLQPNQINAVASFADNAHSRIRISYPSGSPHGRQMASEVAQVLVGQGIAPSMISAASYPAGASAPVQVSYNAAVAVTKECGDWSKDLGDNSSNVAYSNFGCAIQQNTAAMVADPQDFVQPKPMTPVSGSSRRAALLIYYGGGSGSSSGSSSGGASGGSGGGGGGSGGGSGG